MKPDQTYLHEHTVMLKEVLETNLQIKKLTIENKDKPNKKDQQKPTGDERVILVFLRNINSIRLNSLIQLGFGSHFKTM